MIKVISEKRHDLILQELAKKDFLTLQELIDRTGCSASTIRRDLSKLQKIGKLQRVHGGATLNQNRVVEPGLTEKLTQNLREKQEIGKRAAQEIQDNECIFLDAGSSTLEMIQYIDARYHCCHEWDDTCGTVIKEWDKHFNDWRTSERNNNGNCRCKRTGNVKKILL